MNHDPTSLAAAKQMAALRLPSVDIAFRKGKLLPLRHDPFSGRDEFLVSRCQIIDSLGFRPLCSKMWMHREGWMHYSIQIFERKRSNRLTEKYPFVIHVEICGIQVTFWLAGDPTSMGQLWRCLGTLLNLESSRVGSWIRELLQRLKKAIDDMLWEQTLAENDK